MAAAPPARSPPCFDPPPCSAAAVACGVGCTKKPSPAGDGVAAAGGPSASVVRPQRRTIRWTVEMPATILPFEETPVHAKLPGFVGRVLVDIGADVRGPSRPWFGQAATPGTLLAEVAIPELLEEVAAKESLTAQRREEAKVARANVELAGRNHDAADKTVAETAAGEQAALGASSGRGARRSGSPASRPAATSTSSRPRRRGCRRSRPRAC